MKANCAGALIVAMGFMLAAGGSRQHDRPLPTGMSLISPLVIDIDGDGIKTVGLENSLAYFDLNNDFRAELVSWPHPGDGLLVLDRNGDGRIDHGAELFGNFTPLPDGSNAPNGFAALAAFDEDKDGQITPKDPIYSRLRVWSDILRLGESLPADLLPLSELKIESISLQWKESQYVDPGGSAHRQVGTVRIAGKDQTIADVWLRVDPARTIERGPMDLPPDVAKLPHARGFGAVRDLRPAMAANLRLKEMVAKFAATADVATADRMLDDIIFEWAGSSKIDRTARGFTIDARYLNALEAFVGEQFRGMGGGTKPSQKSAEILMAQFAPVRAFLRAQLLAQSHYRDEFGLIVDKYDPRKNIEPTTLQEFTDRLIRLNSAGNVEKVVDLYCTLAAFDLLDGYAPSGSVSLRTNALLYETIESAMDPRAVQAPKAWASNSPDARSGNSELSLGCLDLMRIDKLLPDPPSVGEDISSIPKRIAEELLRAERAEQSRRYLMIGGSALLLLVLLALRAWKRRSGGG